MYFVIVLNSSILLLYVIIRIGETDNPISPILNKIIYIYSSTISISTRRLANSFTSGDAFSPVAKG